MHFIAISINHRTADVALREQVAFRDDEIIEFKNQVDSLTKEKDQLLSKLKSCKNLSKSLTDMLNSKMK